MTEHIGASWDEWRAEHGEPLAIEGILAVWVALGVAHISSPADIAPQ